MKYNYRTSMTFIVLALSFSALLASETVSDWPTWRGINYDMKAEQSDVFKEGYGLKLGWKIPLGSGYSSISIADGHAVTMFSDSTFDYVVSLDATSGAEQWRYKIDSTYVGHDGSHNGPISTPVVSDGKVYALGPKGHLLALDLESGKKIWSGSLPEDHNSFTPFYGFSTSPLVSQDVLIVETSGQKGTVSGFDKHSGKLLWSAGSDTVNYQSPMLFNFNGDNQIVCAGNKHLYGLNPKTGEKYWEFKHNGGYQSTNPVAVGPDKLFFNSSGREAILIEIKKENNDFIVSELWRTRETTRSFNTPVYHEGHLYSYTGRFICSIDAVTGEKNWKSRPPGDGFLILVDEHLVVITKQGAMHVAKASPEGYAEVASLEVFGSLTWTPPSFANGRIYTRNLNEIAAIDIAPTNMPMTMADEQPEKQMWLPNTEFGKWVTKVEKAADKKKLIDEFMAKQKSFPVIEGKKYAHVVYRGDAKDVALAGDMIETNVELPLNKIEGTDFYYASFELKPDARLNYRLNIDFDNRGSDPLNNAQVQSIFGASSQLAMPDWKKSSHYETPKHDKVGTIDSLNFESKVLENARTIKVYLPAGYASSSQRYPVLYVANGVQALQLSGIKNSLDNLIGKSVEPVIAVFIDAPNGFQEHARQQRDQYAEMMAKEIVPMIDEKYRTVAKSEARAIMGGDEAGHAAFNTAFKQLGTFSMVAGQSTHFLNSGGLNEGDLLRKTVKETKKQPLQLYVDWGTYDYRNQRGGYNWVEYNREFSKILEVKGYEVKGGEYSSGWGFASWRDRTDDILEVFFPVLKKTQK